MSQIQQISQPRVLLEKLQFSIYASFEKDYASQAELSCMNPIAIL
jgi:hypothetical protein